MNYGYGEVKEPNMNAGCDAQYTRGVEVDTCDSCKFEFPVDDLTQFVDPITCKTMDLCRDHFTERWCELADDVVDDDRVWLAFFGRGK